MQGFESALSLAHVDAIPSLQWVCDEAGRVLSASPAAAQILAVPEPGHFLEVGSELAVLHLQALHQAEAVTHESVTGWRISCQRQACFPEGSWLICSAQPPVPQTMLLAQIVDFFPNPVFVKNRQHQWIHLNQAFAQFVGHPAEVLLGKSDPDFFDPAAAERYWQQDDTVFDSGEINHQEDFFVDPEGKTHWIVVRKSLFYDTDRKPVLVGVIIDVSAYRETRLVLEKALQRSEEAHRIKANFLARMSHELRTPLHVMLGFSRLLQRNPEALSTEQGQDFVGRIHNNGLGLLRLINDILDLAQLEDHKLSLRSEAFELSILLEEVQQVYLPQAESAGLRLLLEMEPGAMVHSDRERLKQIFGHLLDNAIKFTGRGFVRLRLHRAEVGHWVVSVTDTGPGLSEEQALLIFQPFYQEDESNRRLYGGAGIGLTLAQRLCLHLNCRLELQSILGQGCTFSVVFPAEG